MKRDWFAPVSVSRMDTETKDVNQEGTSCRTGTRPHERLTTR